jgi:hypothetical protein
MMFVILVIINSTYMPLRDQKKLSKIMLITEIVLYISLAAATAYAIVS